MSVWFTCDIETCTRPSVRTTGKCITCDRRLCDTHQRAPHHTCTSTTSQSLSDDAWDALIDAEVTRLRAAVNESALCARASALNGGRACTLEHPPAQGAGSMMGCANYHARLRFGDGSPSWLVRIPRAGVHGPSAAPSQRRELVDYMIASEFATLQFLAGTSVPAPTPYGYALCGDAGNDVGVGYILMAELPGKPWYGQSGGDADADGRKRIWDGLAEILIELRRHPFKRAGSLQPRGDGGVEVGAAASDRFILIDPHGPYDSAAAYYAGFVEQYLALIASHQLFTKYPVNAYLIFAFLREKIPDVCGADAGEFFLKHVDDKGDHLLVDEEGHITGVIDWQMARVVPAAEAFGPSLVTADMGDIDEGRSRLTADDEALAESLRAKGAGALADLMASNDQLRRFFFVDVDMGWKGMQGLVKGLWAAFGVPEDTEWDAWSAQKLREWEGDERLAALVTYEAAGRQG
ncbi:hypothetical protein EDC01DRAFT_697977 [Geopyxis carbonaria]|nr:hypothetical protein EDC01DRAFT_697977 [Geopyxis carbonaria]